MTWIRFFGKLFAKPLTRFLIHSFRDSIQLQERVLAKILKRNRTTQFGKKHQFAEITSIEKFQSYVKPQPYDYFRPYIDSMVQGHLNILIPNKPKYWGQTAGSTGKPKLIPITATSIKNATRGTLLIYLAYLAENPHLHSQFLDGSVCLFSANPTLQYINDVPVGFGTGIFSQSIQQQLWRPFFKELFYSTGHLFQIKDIERRYRILTRETTKRDIRCFSGVTTVVLGLLEVILRYSQRKNPQLQRIKDIFPNYQFSILGGESPQPYEPRLFHLIGKKIDYREVYGATEEIIAVQLQEMPGLTPLLDSNFLEFMPLNSEDRLLINEVKKHVDYKIILTNFNGLYAYLLGDIIRFISLDPPLLLFSRREGTINLASEKMTVQHIITALTKTNQDYHCRLTEYCVVGKYTPKPHYIFIVEFHPSKRPLDEKAYLAALHQNLIAINPVYREQFSGIHAITEPHLWIVKPGTFYELEQQRLEQGVPMGQHKVKHLSKDEHLLKLFETYVMQQTTLS
ncbi:MAG: GH3 family domain-containing protein [Candidatus Helarchaeota archaeon]